MRTDAAPACGGPSGGGGAGGGGGEHAAGGGVLSASLRAHRAKEPRLDQPPPEGKHALLGRGRDGVRDSEVGMGLGIAR